MVTLCVPSAPTGTFALTLLPRTSQVSPASDLHPYQCPISRPHRGTRMAIGSRRAAVHSADQRLSIEERRCSRLPGMGWSMSEALHCSHSFLSGRDSGLGEHGDSSPTGLRCAPNKGGGIASTTPRGCGAVQRIVVAHSESDPISVQRIGLGAFQPRRVIRDEKTHCDWHRKAGSACGA